MSPPPEEAHDHTEISPEPAESRGWVSFVGVGEGACLLKPKEPVRFMGMTGEWDPSACIITCNPDAVLMSLVPPGSWFSSLAGTKREAA